jgi:hypothetical protein
MLALDFLLLIMIGICITYCWILNRRIQDLQNSRIEFARMIKELNVSIVKAETSVSELSELSKVTSHELKSYIVEAKATTDALNVINDISSNLANTLTNQVNTIKREQRSKSSDYRDGDRSSSDQFQRSESLFDDNDLVDLSGDEVKKPAYTNHLKSFISQIVTKKPENMSLNQASYYDTLRRISAKK